MNKLKGKINLLLCILTILMFNNACDKIEEIDPELLSVVFSSNSYTVPEGKTTEFSAFVAPKNNAIYLSNIVIESSDTTTLKVSVVSYKEGKITFSALAKKPGRVTITITAKEKTATAVVDVSPQLIPSIKISVKSINLTRKIVYTGISESITIITNVLPKNATDTTVVWSSNSNNIVIDYRGVITPLDRGIYTLIATSRSNPNIKDTCQLYVGIRVSKVILYNRNILMKIGSRTTLTANFAPSEADNKIVVWKSSNSNSVSIDPATIGHIGLINAVDYGIATVTTSLSYDNSIFDQATVIVASLKLNKNTLTLPKDATETLTYNLLPVNFRDKNVIWTSDNINVATVDNKTGTILTKSKGTANIIVSSPYHPNLVDTCKLTVIKAVEKINVNYQTLSLTVGNTEKLIATVYPLDAIDKTVSWSSDAEDIATVDANNGNVNALNTGKVNIIATSNYGDKSIKDTCVLTITSGKNGISLSNNNLKLKIGQKFIITANVDLPSQTNKNVVWSSDASGIASVNSASGEISGVSVGMANIIATSVANSNLKDTCKVNVIKGVDNIKIDKTILNLDVNSKDKILVTFEPADATENEYTWLSNDPNIATIDANGNVITYNQLGTTILTVTSNSDITKFAKCTVNVSVFVKGITLNYHMLNMKNAETFDLTYTLNPINPTNSEVIWSSNNPSIVSVLNGKITSYNERGTAKIYAQSVSNPNVKDSCEVTVTPRNFDMILSKTELFMEVGNVNKITATIVSTLPVDQSVTWKSSDVNVATVVGGEIRANALGEADIIATSVYDNTLIKICKVKVSILVKNVIISEDTIRFFAKNSKTVSYGAYPPRATDKTLIWTSTNPNIKVVDGTVSGDVVARGYIYATSVNGIKDSCYVIVSSVVTGMRLSNYKLNMNIGEVRVITAVIDAPVPVDQSVIWKSSDENIATVKGGSIQANAVGDVDIIATSVFDNYFVQICKVNVSVVVDRVDIIEDTIRINKNELKTLNYKVYPELANNKALTWSSVNPKISVTDGVVKGIDIGSGYVYATSVNGVKDSCYVIVYSKLIGIYLSENELKLNKGASKTLTVSVVASTPIDQTVKWISSNPSIATVTSNGLVEAKNRGIVDIKVISIHFPNDTAICKVTVLIPATSVVLDKDTIRIYKGSIFLLRASVLPTDASSVYVTWISKSPSFKVVYGEVHGLSEGEGYVYAVSNYGVNNDIKDSCYVIVSIYKGSLSLSQTKLNLNKGTSAKITATFSHREFDQSVTWSSSNNLIATVSSNGEINALSPGNVNIIATSNYDNTLFAICSVTVSIFVEQVNIVDDEISLYENESKNLDYLVYPLDATDKTLKWSSSNNLVTVDNGVVKAVGGTGTSKVYAVSHNNIKDSVTVNITINDKLPSFKFEASKNSGMENDVRLISQIGGYSGDFKYIAKVKLIPTFFTGDATNIVKVNDVVQISGVTEQDFTSPVIYKVYSASNDLIKTLRVSINFINDTLMVNDKGLLFCKPSYIPYIKTVILADSMNGSIIKYIGNNAFANAENIMSNLNLPNSLVSIGNYAFSFCSNLVGTLKLPQTLNYLGEGAFQRCSGLIGDITIPTSIYQIKAKTFERCTGFNGYLTLPDNLMEIGNSAFDNCNNIKSFNFPSSLDSIGNSAFYNCYSAKGFFDFKNGLIYIGEAAFAACYGMTGDLLLPSSITYIGNSAFSTCQGLNGKLVLPGKLTVIETNTFYNCVQLTGSVDIPNSVKSIKSGAFKNSGLSGLTLSNTLTEIGEAAFCNMYKLRGNIVIPNTVTTIDKSAFQNCVSLIGTLKLSTNLKTIGESAFENCGFTGDLYIYSSVTNIGDRAFLFTSNFNSVTYSSKTIIGINAFASILPSKIFTY